MEVKDRSWLFLDKLGDSMTARVIDTEVTVRNKEDYSAFVPENRLAYIGCLYADKEHDHISAHISTFDDESERFSSASTYSLDKNTIIVGHNIKYDLHWMMRVGMITKGGIENPGSHRSDKYILDDIPLVWDTQLVEYLLTGQQARMISLDNLCRARGLPVKPDWVKKLWKAGVLTKDIDPSVMQIYLKHDCEATRSIYLKQLDEVRARPKAFQFLVQSQLNMLRMVTLMEWNGLCLDTAKCIEMQDEMALRLERIEKLDIPEAIDDIGLLVKPPPELLATLNMTSNRTVAAFVFGDVTIYYKVREEHGRYKNGKTRYVTRIRAFHFPRRDLYEDLKRPDDGADGYPSVDEYNLTSALSECHSNAMRKYIELILEHRKLAKMHGTYLSKLPTFIRTPANSLIHHNLNQCIAATGRLTSSNPNMQNRPEEVSRLFKSRFKKGMIVSVDFSQIEVFALAQMCRDRQLIDDLNSGKDIHWETACEVYPGWRGKTKADVPHRPYRDIKSTNFGLLYGGSVSTVSRESGVPKAIVAKTKEALYNRYPGILEWQNENIRKVNESSRVLPHSYHEGGLPKHFGTLRLETGRVYVFNDMISPEWVKSTTGLETSFLPTQIKNYPIQGTATGDWVPLLICDMFGFVFTKHPESFVPINTTHDDIELDVDLSVIDAVGLEASHEDVATTIESVVNDYIIKEFPKLWNEWTSTSLLVTPKVNVKVIYKTPGEES